MTPRNRSQRFLMTKTKKELWENILQRRLFGAPVANAADIASDPQLKARDYFVTSITRDSDASSRSRVRSRR